MEIPDKELHRIVSTCLIYDDDKYLIVKRSPNKKVYPNKWHIPGGGLSTDDYDTLPPTRDDQWYYSLTNGLKREIEEEVGLKIGKPEYLLDLTFKRPDGIPVLVLSFFSEYLGGEVKLNHESVDFRWITVDEVGDYDMIGDINEEIRMVDKILKSRKKE